MASTTDYIYGVHAVRHALVGASDGSLLLIQKGTAGERPVLRTLRGEAKRLGLRVEVVSKGELTRLAGGGNHQGIALYQPQQQQLPVLELDTLLQSLPSAALLLVLDSVQDPRNLGACLRTAAAAGVKAAIAPSRRSAPLSNVAYKAASGGAERVPVVRVTNLSETIRRLKKEDIWTIGLDGSADMDIYDPNIPMTGRVAFVVGAEGKGLRRSTRDHCDFCARIPMDSGGVESLNVSVAVGIALFEAYRRSRS